MRTILITLDSLNRHFLSMYNAKEIETPCMEKLAKEGIVFEKHFTASAPCMPARRELLTGTLELRHRSWGPLEPFDKPISKTLKDIGCPTMLITDHYHYFEKGGENYHTDFTGYELIRGHEEDNWKTFNVEIPKINKLTHTSDIYERNRAGFTSKENYPSALTFSKAEEWAIENIETKDFFLYIDEFDPHEPFMVPDEYLEKYDKSRYDGDLLEWAIYGKWKGDESETAHLRNRYKAKICFIDDCLEKFCNILKKNDMYDDTTIIVTTDHGHYLGEHGYTGKPCCNNYNTLFNIPLIIKPATSIESNMIGKRVTGLTSTPDIPATILDIHGLKIDENLYGKSFIPLITGETEKIRDYVLYGYYGRQLGCCDGEYTYLKSPSEENTPLYYYSTRITTHPSLTNKFQKMFKDSDDKSIGNYLPNIDYPVMKFKLSESIFPMKWKNIEGDALFDYQNDIEQKNDIDDVELHKKYRKFLKSAMIAEKFPKEEFLRLGVN